MNTETPTNTLRSLTAISERNSELLSQMEFVQDDPQSHAKFAQMAHQFIDDIAASGAVLSDYYERAAAQKFADYWAHYLYQQKFAATISPVRLALYDPHAVSEWAELTDDDFPYSDLAPELHSATPKLLPSRQTAVDRCLKELEQSPVALLLGSPHSGRSVVLRAGLTPRLRDPSNSLGVRDVRVISFAAAPLASLRALCESAGTASSDASGAADAKRTNWERWRLGSDHVLIIDSFEDLYAATVSDDDRAEVLSQLETFVNSGDRANRLILVATNAVRDELKNSPFLGPFLEQATTLSAVDSRELLELIQAPAERIGLVFAVGLVEELVSVVVGDPGALPWLYLALRRLWGKRNQNVIDWQAYRGIGGEAFLQRELDGLIADAERRGVSRELIRALLLQLVTSGPTPESFDCPMKPIQQLVEALERPFPGSAAQVRTLLDQLVASGFLSYGPPQAADSPSVAITHPGLIHAWPDLLHWREEALRDQQDWRQLVSAAAAWRKFSRAISLLWTDSGAIAIGYKTIDRALASGVVTERHGDLILAQEFLRASQQDLERAYRRRLSLLISLAVLGFVGAIVCACFAVAARWASQEATQSANRLLVTQSEHAVDVNDVSASLVWLSASIDNQSSSSDRATEPLKRQWSALWHQLARLEFFATVPPALTSGDSTRRDHGIVPEPEGRWIVVPDNEGIRLQRTNRTGEYWPLKLPERPAGDRNFEFCTTQTRFSGNGRWLAAVVRCSAPLGQCLVVWRIPHEIPRSGTPLNGIELIVPAPRSDAADTSLPILIAFADASSAQSPPVDPDDDPSETDRAPILVAAQGRHMSLWRLSSASTPPACSWAISDRTNTVAIVTAVAASWNLRVTRSSETVVGASAALSPQLCVYASYKTQQPPNGSPTREEFNGGATACWQFPPTLPPAQDSHAVETKQEIQHGFTVDTIQTSPFDDQLVALLNAQRQECLLWLRGSESRTKGTSPFRVSTRTRVVAFSPDGQLFAAGSPDAVILWRIRSRPESREPFLQYVRRLEHDSDVFSLAFSPDGQLLASGSRDRTARVWHVPTGTLFLPPMTHANTVSRIRFSSDGKHLTTVDGQRSVRRFAVESTNPAPRPIAMTGPGRIVAALDGQGRYLVVQAGLPAKHPSSQAERLPELYEVQTDRIDLPVPLNRRGVGNPTSASEERSSAPSCAAFSPNGRTLAIGYLVDGILEWRTSEPQTFEDATPHAQTLPRPPLDTTSVREGGMLALSKSGEYAVVIVQGSEAGYACVCRRPRADESTRPAHVPRWFPVWRNSTTSGGLADPSLHSERINSIAISPDGRWISTASNDDRIRLWPVAAGSQSGGGPPIKSIENAKAEGHSADATVVQFVRPQLPSVVDGGPHSYVLTSAGADGAVIVWSFATDSPGAEPDSYRLTRRHRIDSPGNLRCFDLSSNGDWLVVGAQEGHLAVWQLDPTVRRARLQHAGPILSAAFDPRDNRIVSICRPSEPFMSNGPAATNAPADQIWVYRWNLHPVEAASKTLVTRAQFLAAREYSPLSGSLQPIGDAKLAELYDGDASDHLSRELPASPDSPDERSLDVTLAAHIARKQWFAARWHAARGGHGSRNRTRFAVMLVDAASELSSTQLRADLEERERMHVVSLVDRVLELLPDDDIRRYDLLRRRADAYRRLGLPLLAISDFETLAAWRDDGKITLADRAKTLFLLAESQAETARAYASLQDTRNEDAYLRLALTNFQLCRDIYRMLPAHELELVDAWHNVALLHCRESLDDAAGLTTAPTNDKYSQECAAMWSYFRGTTDPLVANTVAWTCGLSPRSGVSPVDLRDLVDASAERERPYYQQNVLSALLFRQAQASMSNSPPDQSLQLMKEARDAAEEARVMPRTEATLAIPSLDHGRFDVDVTAGTPYDWVLLSLIHESMDRLEGGSSPNRMSSRQWYSNLNTWLAKQQSSRRVQWNQLLELEILRREYGHAAE